MSKKLVAYFSASGVTAKVAETLAEAIGADIFEIEPKVPYTEADLNWMDKKARSTIEMNDPASRPEIAVKRDNMKDYDTIFVGFPIWWYVAPTIINTFLESYDLTGKTIIPFATSGGSDIGKTNERLAPSCKGAKLIDGKVFKGCVGHQGCWVAAVWTAAFIVPQDRSCWWNVKRSTAAKPGAQKSRRAISCPANMSFTQSVRAGMTGGTVSANC